MKRVLLAAALVAASVGGVQGAFAQNMPVQERVDLDMTGRIRQEAFQRSQVMATLNHLTDVIGPRLTNSPAMAEANKWTRSKFTEWGLANVHDEWQIEVDEDKAEFVGKTAQAAIRKAGDHFGFRCPLDGEFKIGRNWAETH